jgi:hypothetical protein
MEQHTPRSFDSRVLRKVFETKTKEVGGYRRKLRNEEHRDLYCSPNTIRVVK